MRIVGRSLTRHQLKHLTAQIRSGCRAFVLLTGEPHVVVAFGIARQADRPIVIVVGMPPARGEHLSAIGAAIVIVVE